MADVSLTIQELQLLSKACPRLKCITYTIARLYFTTARGGWKYSGLEGILGLFGKNNAENLVFVLVSPITGETQWTYNIDPRIQYEKERPNFHSFFSEDKLIGVLHAEGFELLSDSLYDVVSKTRNASSAATTRTQNAKDQPASRSSSVSLHRAESDRDHTSQPAKSSSVKSKSSGGILRPFFNWSSKKSGGGKDKITKDQIGDPTNLQHISHVGYDKVNGFCVRNVSEKWIEILNIAGISTQNLEANPELANYAKRFLIKNYNAIAETSRIEPSKVLTPTEALKESIAYSQVQSVPLSRGKAHPSPDNPSPKLPMKISNRPAQVISVEKIATPVTIQTQTHAPTSPKPPSPIKYTQAQVTNRGSPSSPSPTSQKLRPVPPRPKKILSTETPVRQPPAPPPLTAHPPFPSNKIPPVSSTNAPPPPPPPPSSSPPLSNSVPQNAVNPASAVHGNLMQSIRSTGGTSFLKTSTKDRSIKRQPISRKDTSPPQESSDTPSKPETTTATIAEALKEALLRRNAAIDPTDSESDDDNAGTWS